jgi:hypothetical protein
MRNLWAFLVALCGSQIVSAQSGLDVYPAPEGAKLNTAFTVEVRQGDGPWLNVPTYEVKVAEVVETRQTVRPTSMAYFDFEGEAEVRVVSRETSVNTAAVRPLSKGITPALSGDTLKFTLNEPANLSVEVNGDLFNNLHLFANPLDAHRPSPRELKRLKKDKNYLYYGPGVHRVDSLILHSGQTLYVAGGAVIDGFVEVKDAEDVHIWGRGMVYPTQRGSGLRVSRSKYVDIDGLMTTQCPVGQSDSVLITNVKVMSYFSWGDGFNVFASSNVTYRNVFARTSDDCTTVYATRLGYYGGCRNILMEHSTLWADVAHPVFIGLHGNVEKPDTIEHLVYRDIDILDMKEKQIDYQGALSIVTGDNNLVRDVRFEDIRIENFRQGKLFDLRVAWNRKYCGAPGRGIRDVVFKNITYTGDRSELSLICGYDDSRTIEGVQFQNLVINGLHVSDDMPGKPGYYKTADMARIFVGEHVKDVSFQ